MAHRLLNTGESDERRHVTVKEISVSDAGATEQRMGYGTSIDTFGWGVEVNLGVGI